MAQKSRRRKSLPPIDPQTDRRLRPFLEAVKEITETGDGVRGDPMDRKLTMRDLVDSGIGSLRGAGKGSSGVLQPGSAIDNDAPGNKAVPPKPSGLQAFGSFGYVALSWGMPGDLYSNHGFTSIYRASEDNFANAVIVGQDAGMSYTDQVRDVAEEGVGYYYWITFTSSAGIEGPPNAPGGTYAEVIPDVRFIMQRITGEIDDGVLARSLKSKIDLVVAPESVEGSVNARLADEATARRQALAAEAEQRADSIDRERKDRKESIDAVTAAYDRQIADLADKTQVLTEEDEALARQIETAFAQAKEDRQAALRDERTAWTTKTDALGSRIDTTQARVEDNAADITETQESLASKTSALTKTIESMTARLNATPTWSSNFEPGADFDRWKTASGGSIEAVSTAFAGNQAAVIRYSGSTPSSTSNTHSVYAEVTETLAKGFVGKRIRVEVYARKAQDNPASEFAVAYSTAANGNSGWHYFEPGDDWAPFEFMWDMPVDSSNAVDYVGIWGDTSNSGKGVEVDLITIRPATTEEDLPAITAAINAESEARVEANKAQTKRFNEDISQLGDDISGVRETVNTEVERLDGRVNSVSNKVDTVQSTLNGDVASVRQSMNTEIQRVDGELEVLGAQWTAQVQANGLVGGFGVRADGQEVEAGFDVDRFFVGRTNNKKVKPFLVGSDGVSYLDTARIRRGDIQEGQLGPITIGKLTQNNGQPLTNVAGKIRADAIDADNLRVAEAAKFYGDVYSGNYRSGRRGWAILQNGNVEFNEGTFNGKVEFRNVQGAGKLAGKDRLWWSEIDGGNKPENNADVTGNHTSKDTNRVAGRYASTVRDEAREGRWANNRKNQWTRPGSTLIDGNKIYTGDAYVDTLQIKGNAITIPAAAYKGGSTHRYGGGWFDRMRFYGFNQDGATTFINAFIPYSAADSESTQGGSAEARISLEIRIVIDENTRRYVKVVDLSAYDYAGTQDTARASVSDNGTAIIGFKLPPRSGRRNIKLQVKMRNCTIRDSYMQLQGVKR